MHNLFWVCSHWLIKIFGFFIRLCPGEKSSQQFWRLYELIIYWMGCSSIMISVRLWAIICGQMPINLISHLRHNFLILSLCLKVRNFCSNIHRLSVDVLVTCLGWNCIWFCLDQICNIYITQGSLVFLIIEVDNRPGRETQVRLYWGLCYAAIKKQETDAPCWLNKAG